MISTQNNTLHPSPLAELPAIELVQRLVNDIGGSETVSEIDRRLHGQKWFGHFADDVSDEGRLELIAALLLTAKNASDLDHRITAMVYLREVKEPVVVNEFIDIATNDSDLNIRHCALSLLPYLSRSDLRTLIILLQN